MLNRRRFPALAALAVPFAASVITAQPVVRVLEPAGPVPTEASSIRLQGIGITNSAPASIYWIDQRGSRGSAEWTAVQQNGSTVRWSAEAPLRPGANRFTVIVVDRENRAGSAQVSVRRSGIPGAQPSAIQSGTWQGRPAVYSVLNGMAIVEGDIILGTAEELSAAEDRLSGHGKQIRHYGFTDSHRALLWPLVGSVFQIPYTIQNGSANVNAAISYVNTVLAGVLQLVPQTSEANYVTFNLNPSAGGGEGCQSSVGMIGIGQQFISGSAGCTVASLVHEIGHTIGLLHEHQRPDRNAWVTFTPINADKPLIAGNLDFFTTNMQPIGLYDYSSVMHYPPFEFTKNNLPVLESIPPGIPLGNNTGFSAGDLDQVSRLYGRAPAAVTVTTNPAGLKIMVDGVVFTAPHSFTWALNSTHQLDLPPDPQQTNPADGSSYSFGRWNDNGARSHSISTGGGSGALTSPANKPLVTVYEANCIRLQPFSLSVTPAGAGAANVTPAPQSVFGGSFFVDRQKVTVTATPNAGQNFFGWFGPPLPQSQNPYSFLIQSPLTNAQAAFTTFPVTIIGETITGPNTWDPPLFAFVDGNFTDLPQAFSPAFSGSSWAAGSSHTVNAPSPDVPVTTNVSYSWNSWSDGGAQTHTISASSSGVTGINASYTPMYRSYAFPQQNCGIVQYSPPCANNDCSFADGTPVTMTATPNAGNGMVFAGWTGDLSGLTNPQNTTVHDEFLPVANFNVVPTVLAISSITPATPVATAAARDLTVNGSGFVASSFFTYWNGSFRNSSVVSPTQATMHLNAGDLAAAGGQDIEVANFTSSCGAEAFQSILVKATSGTPRLHITKTHQGNFTHGQSNANYSVTITNMASATGATIGTVTATERVPTGLTLVSMTGTGWTCSASTCTRGDRLAPGASYPAITVTVSVSPTAPSSVVNVVTVSGGDSPAAHATDTTQIN